MADTVAQQGDAAIRTWGLSSSERPDAGITAECADRTRPRTWVPYADVFVRLSDVDEIAWGPYGCGPRPTHVFERGHRIRVQVFSWAIASGVRIGGGCSCGSPRP